MSPDLIISKSIIIDSNPSNVWDVLINPDKIKQYFTGAETLTDWQPGSEIIFVHNYILIGRLFQALKINLKIIPK